MYFFFDTETTGLPKKWNSSYKHVNKWPRMVQIAFLLVDENGSILESGNYLIKPNDFKIPKKATKIHGITTDFAINNGFELKAVLKIIDKSLRKSESIVGHNVRFDVNVLGAEFHRSKMQNPCIFKNELCTMRLTKDYCALGVSPNFKWPTLSELYYKLFDKYLSRTHNAFDDIESTAKCFWELIEKNLINVNMTAKSKADWLLGFLNSLEHSDNVTSKQIKVLRNKFEQFIEEIGFDSIDDDVDVGGDDDDDDNYTVFDGPSDDLPF